MVCNECNYDYWAYCLWHMLKDEVYSNDTCTEDDTKKNHSLCSIFSFTCNSDKQWTTCLSDVKNICELTETISSIFFNMASKNLVLTMTNLTIMPGPQLMTNWISRACCALCCHAKWYVKWQTISTRHTNAPYNNSLF
jgi:hypothetical protein